MKAGKNHQKIECVYLGFKLTVFDFFPYNQINNSSFQTTNLNATQGRKKT